MPAWTPPPRTLAAPRVRGVLWLALLALLLRALMPAGYMPAARSSYGGGFELTLCSAAGGLATLPIALSPADKSDRSGGHDIPADADAGAQCPFGLLAHVTPAPLAPTALPRMRAPRPSASVPLIRLPLPAQPAQGPPLGSRAPPPRA